MNVSPFPSYVSLRDDTAEAPQFLPVADIWLEPESIGHGGGPDGVFGQWSQRIQGGLPPTDTSLQFDTVNYFQILTLDRILVANLRGALTGGHAALCRK